MRIKDISIRHFRGFEHQTFELDPQMNVVLGDNTSGKTTLLHGVQVALGAYLQALTLLPGGKPYRRNFKDSDWVRKYSEANRSFLRIQEKPEIAVTADFFVHTFQLPQSKVKISLPMECLQNSMDRRVYILYSPKSSRFIGRNRVITCLRSMPRSC